MGIFEAVTVDEQLDSLFTTISKVPEAPKEMKTANRKEKAKDDGADNPEHSSKLDAKEQDDIKIYMEEEEEPKEPTESLTRRAKAKLLIYKNERTIFVGNLPVTVMEKAGMRKLKHAFGEYGKLVSIRFRSIAFNEKLPRKRAFILKKFHEKRDSVNAYIVYAAKESAENALQMNGSLFLDRHIRVDYVETKVQKQRDSQRCVFIGNLAFDVSDEQIWKFFEDAGDIENVRVIRDKKTNVGKGFGYVQFKDKSSVFLALKLNDIELAGRKIRVTRAVESLADKSKASSAKTNVVIEGSRARRPEPKAVAAKPRLSLDGKRTKKPRHVPRIPGQPRIRKNKAVDSTVPKPEPPSAANQPRVDKSKKNGIATTDKVQSNSKSASVKSEKTNLKQTATKPKKEKTKEVKGKEESSKIEKKRSEDEIKTKDENQETSRKRRKDSSEPKSKKKKA